MRHYVMCCIMTHHDMTRRCMTCLQEVCAVPGLLLAGGVPGGDQIPALPGRLETTLSFLEHIPLLEKSCARYTLAQDWKLRRMALLLKNRKIPACLSLLPYLLVFLLGLASPRLLAGATSAAATAAGTPAGTAILAYIRALLGSWLP